MRGEDGTGWCSLFHNMSAGKVKIGWVGKSQASVKAIANATQILMILSTIY